MLQLCERAMQDSYRRTQPWATSKQPPVKYCTNLSCLSQEKTVSAQKFCPDLQASPPDLYAANRKASYKAHLRNYSTSFKPTLALTLAASQVIIIMLPINKAGSQTTITCDVQMRLD